MRKRLWIPIALLLALTLCVPGVYAEEDGAELAMEFFSGMIGSVAFALPGHAAVVHEEDYPGAWTDSVQMLGRCAEDGAEFQLHAADVQGLIDYFAQQYPDGDPSNARLNAMMNYCLFYPLHYGAALRETEPFLIEDTGVIGADVAFTYPDAPGEEYHAKCFLEGSTAVGLVIQECRHARRALEELKTVTAEEKEAFLAVKAAPVFLDLHGLSVTYPCAYTVQETEEMLLTACFSADFTFMEVNYTPQAWDITGTEERQMEFMLEAAKKMLVPFDTEDVLEPALSHPTETALRLDFSAVDKSVFGDYGPKMLCRVYAGAEGLWQVVAADTDTGRAFLNAVRLAGESAPADPGLPEGPAAETAYPAFRQALYGLMDRSALGFRLKSGNFEWSEALCSGGRWMRGLFSPDLEVLVQLILTAPEEDADIREIRVLRLDDSTAPEEDFLLLARLCALALTGEDAGVAPEHVDVEGSGLVYDRVILSPAEPAAPAAALPEPEGNIPDITGVAVPASAFESRCAELAARLTDAAFSCEIREKSAAETEVRVYRAGDVGMLIYLDGIGDDAPVSMVIVMGAEARDCPSVLLATVIAYAAVTDYRGPMDLPSWALIETPLWGDLADLWPLLSDGRVCAHLQEDDDGAPMGFVAGLPGN